MSDNIDPREAEKRLICMADLSRIRQEELPLSNEERRGPSFNPTRRNGTSHIDPALKTKLSEGWAVKIEDEESEQMKGLANDQSRPWAKEETMNILAKAGPEAAPPRVGPPSIIPKRSRGDDDAGSFPPTKKSGARVSYKPTAPVAQWGPSKNTPAPEQPLPTTQEAGVVRPQVEHEHNENVPEVSAVAPSSESFKFVLNPKALDVTMAEHVIGTGQCQVVPAQDESRCFVAEVTMKLLISENRAVLKLSASGKSYRVHDALDLSDPVMDGQLCSFKQLSNGSFFYLRFADENETKKFKRYLAKMQKSARVHQPQDANPKVEEQQASLPNQESTTSTLATLTEQPEPLIEMSSGWESVENDQVPTLENATKHVVRLVNRMLGQISLEGRVFESALEGIEDGIIDHWVQNGFLRNYNDSLKDEFLALLRAMVRIEIQFQRRAQGVFETNQGVRQATQGFRELSLQDAPGASPQVVPRDSPQPTSASQYSGRKGLGASRYATGPVAFEGCFTGPRAKNSQ
ncbi:hypothetical protein ACHAPT_004874 [Fusarium lateritium]